MSQPNDSQRDELRDRLLEQALRETLGDESPPDLSHRILAAADEQTSELPQPVGDGVMRKSKKKFWSSFARTVAIGGVVVVFGAFLFLSKLGVRTAARLVKQDNVSESVGNGEKTQRLPSGIHSYHSTYGDMYGAPDTNAMPPRYSQGYFDYVEGPIGPTVVPGASGPAEKELLTDFAVHGRKDRYQPGKPATPFPGEPPVVYPTTETWI